MDPYARSYRIDARAVVDRECHGALLRSVAHLDRVPSPAWYELRRKREKWWSNLLTHMDEAVASGAPLNELLNIPQMLEWYLYDSFDDRLRPFLRMTR